MPDTIADLSAATDLELDAALQLGFKLYAQAKHEDDHAEMDRLHDATMLILDVQSQRRHVWLDHTLGLE